MGIRKSVYQFKFHNKREYAGFYVSEMERVCGNEIRTWNPDVIIPIPMYKRKKRQRGYNQAEILAKCLGKRLQIPVDTKSLVRVRKTIPQKSLGRKEREINLKNAFKTSTNALELKKVQLGLRWTKRRRCFGWREQKKYIFLCFVQENRIAERYFSETGFYVILKKRQRNH